MGNTQASSNSPPTRPCMKLFPSPTPQIFPSEERMENPGSVESLYDKCAESTSEKPSYKFGFILTDTKQHGSRNYDLLLMGDIDLCGNISSNVVIRPWNKVKVKLNTQFRDFKTNGIQISAEYKADRCGASLYLISRDFFIYTAMYVTQVLYARNNNTSLGAQIVHKWNSPTTNGQITVFNITGRYAYDNAISVSTTLSLNGMQCYCYYKASELFQFNLNLVGSFLQQKINATLVCKARIPEFNFNFKGCVDREWNVSATLEKRIYPMPFTFVLSTMFSPIKPQLRIGIGFLVI